jgi:hypothetical protein
VLFELSTDEPGMTVAKPAVTLRETLCLSASQEELREAIVGHLLWLDREDGESAQFQWACVEHPLREKESCSRCS